MLRKSFPLADVEFKADKEGSFRARLATLNVVDRDGDVTVPGAFPVGKSVVISAYMHSSWSDALPVGSGVIGASDSEAWVDGQFFTDTTTGKDHYLTVKALAQKGLGEWSYGYEPLSASTDKADLEPYPGATRILKSLGVFEASPVLVGAGVNTGTESIKGLGGITFQEQAEHALTSMQAFIARSKSLADLRAKEGRTLSAANRDRLSGLLGVLTSAQADIQELLTATDSDAGKSAEVETAELNAVWLNLQKHSVAA